MNKFFSSLTFKIGIVIILVEIVILTGLGFFYITRFNTEIDNRIIAKVQLTGVLLNNRFVAVYDQAMIANLIGEDLLNLLVVNSQGRIVHSLFPEDLGREITEIPRVNLQWFNPGLTKTLFEVRPDGVIGVSPVRSTGEAKEILFYVYMKVDTAQTEQEKQAATRVFVLGSLATVITTSIVIIILFNSMIGQRITRLLTVLRRVESGDLKVRVEGPISSDQIGVLQTGVNSMAEELQRMVGTLEDQVQERTRELRQSEAAANKRANELEIVAFVSATASTLLDTTELLQRVVNLTKNAFDLYHVHIYLLDESGDTLTLIAGAGETGEQMVRQGWEIPLQAQQSLVARAARAHQGDIVNDVRADPNWLPNPLLPDTRSELAVPLLVGGQVLGVLDVQSDQVNYFSEEDIQVQNTLATQVAVALKNAGLFEEIAEANTEIQMLNERLKEENLRMTAELDVTRRLQQMLLPSDQELHEIEGMDIAGFMEPAAEVGGDYYDVLQRNGQIKIGMGDITGHGLESGVLMLMTQTAIRTLMTSNEQDPIRFINILNRTLHDNIQRMAVDKSLTLVLLDYQTGQVRVSGQHEQLIVVRRNGQVTWQDTLELGIPIGLVDEIGEFVNEMTIDLQPGDGLVLYSDGFTEAENESGEFYGLERLGQVVSRHWSRPAEEIKQAVVGDVRQFIGKQKVYDDLTLLVIKQK